MTECPEHKCEMIPSTRGHKLVCPMCIIDARNSAERMKRLMEESK